MAKRAVALVQNKEEGQGMVEYGLIIALVAVVAIAGLIILGPKLSTLFTSLGSSV
jgi:pilus assembly protein Flp/PilA